MASAARLLVALILGMAAIAANPGAARAHAGHEPPPGVVVISPRAEGRVGVVEIVAEFAPGNLLAVFLSRFSDSAQVTGVTVEASTELQSAALTESDSGIYVTREILLADGRNDIEIKFTIGGVSRIHTLRLIGPSPHHAPAVLAVGPLFGLPPPLEIGGGIALALMALYAAALLARRRRRPGQALGSGMA